MEPFDDKSAKLKKIIRENLYRTNPFVRNMLDAQRLLGLSWEQTMEHLVITLVNHSEDLQDKLLDVYCKSTKPIFIMTDHNNKIIDPPIDKEK